MSRTVHEYEKDGVTVVWTLSLGRRETEQLGVLGIVPLVWALL